MTFIYIFIAMVVILAVLEKWFPYDIVKENEKNPVNDMFYLGMRILTKGFKGYFVALFYIVAQKLGMPEGYVGFAAEWSFATQVVVCFLSLDFIHFFAHWAHHKNKFLWKLHAVHHAPIKFYWEGGLRIHFISHTIYAAIYAIPIFFFQFSPEVLEWFFIAKFLVAIPQHANVGINMRWLNYILAWWDIHRWHHATDRAAWETNYSTMFPIWDIIFGTFYFPKNRQPIGIGIGSIKDFPQSFWASHLAPFHYERFTERQGKELEDLGEPRENAWVQRLDYLKKRLHQRVANS